MKINSQIFKDKKYYVFALVLVFFAILIYWGTTRDFSIAEVNGTSISMQRFVKNYNAASMYNNKIAERESVENNELAKLSDKEIKIAILDKLIESVIIRDDAEDRVGKELDDLVSKRIKSYMENQELDKAAKALYGMSMDEFTKEVLIPQATQDILKNRLFIDGVKYDEWFKEAVLKAEVIIYSDEFAWKDGKVFAN